MGLLPVRKDRSNFSVIISKPRYLLLGFLKNSFKEFKILTMNLKIFNIY